jgi:hypothetical protein
LVLGGHPSASIATARPVDRLRQGEAIGVVGHADFATQFALQVVQQGLAVQPDRLSHLSYPELGGNKTYCPPRTHVSLPVPMLELNGFITHYEPNDADSEQWKVFLRFKFGDY